MLRAKLLDQVAFLRGQELNGQRPEQRAAERDAEAVLVGLEDRPDDVDRHIRVRVHVANFSRDWVIMKFPLRLPYGTDTERVRKMIKKLGRELRDDPELGGQFLQPLKSQGVVQMEDSAMIVPVKLMARPGEQWMLRRLVLTRIHELFEAKGIRFANREVTVRLGDIRQTDVLDAADREAIAGAAARLLHDEASELRGAQPADAR
jgi:hypothetical protein